MNWDAISAVSEVIGVAAVIATIFYLAQQIRQSNAYAKASTAHDTNAFFAQVFSQLAQDPELASIYSRALKNEPLDDGEAVRFAAFVNTYLACFEDFISQAEAELGFSEYAGNAEKLFDVAGPYAFRLLNTDAGKQWWTNDAPYQYSPGFVEAVNIRILSAKHSKSEAPKELGG